MRCPTISGLELDRNDEEALKKIRRITRAGEILKLALPAGVLTTIFLGSKPLTASYNIQSTDWVLFAKAMNSVSPIVRHQISLTAKTRLLRGDLTDEQRQFWRAVAAGCKR